jgi:hypothetical protein
LRALIAWLGWHEGLHRTKMDLLVMGDLMVQRV